MNYSAAQRKYQFWLSLPSHHRPRDLATREKLAERLHVQVSTLDVWETLPGWWQEVQVYAAAIIGRDLPEILRALVERAKEGNVPAVKLSLQVLGVYNDKIEQTVSFEDDQLLVIVGKDSPKALKSGKKEDLEVPAETAPTDLSDLLVIEGRAS